MKYIIMADGKGTRWNNYNNIPKHFIKVGEETLLARTVRMLKEADAESEIIITSHDSRYEVEGARRYEPKNNKLEIDRFTEELIEDNICFMYGDTLYSEKAIDQITHMPTEDILFFGNKKSIVAVKVKDSALFRSHVHRVRQLYIEGKLETCIGWQVYQSFLNVSFNEKKIYSHFIYIEDETHDFNSPTDLQTGEKI